MLRRWRNSHGFGVHSPFGFQLVERVIRHPRGYAYYAYPEIDRCCRREHNQGNIAEEARMLLRLACMLKPESVYLPPDAGKVFPLALKSYDSRLRLVRNAGKATTCDIIASEGDHIPLECLCRFIAGPLKAILLRNAPENWSETLFEAMKEGIMIRGKRNTILISRPEMQKVMYQMSI